MRQHFQAFPGPKEEPGIMQRALEEAAMECLNLAFFPLPTGLQYHLACLHPPPALCCMESHATTSGIFSEPP